MKDVAFGTGDIFSGTKRRRVLGFCLYFLLHFSFFTHLFLLSILCGIKDNTMRFFCLSVIVVAARRGSSGEAQSNSNQRKEQHDYIQITGKRAQKQQIGDDQDKHSKKKLFTLAFIVGETPRKYKEREDKSPQRFQSKDFPSRLQGNLQQTEKKQNKQDGITR